MNKYGVKFYNIDSGDELNVFVIADDFTAARKLFAPVELNEYTKSPVLLIEKCDMLTYDTPLESLKGRNDYYEREIKMKVSPEQRIEYLLSSLSDDGLYQYENWIRWCEENAPDKMPTYLEFREAGIEY